MSQTGQQPWLEGQRANLRRRGQVVATVKVVA